MYNNIIKRLRNCATQAAPCKTCDLYGDVCCTDTLMKQAADAIEELSRPQWISVTERLPEEAGIYRVCGRWRGKQFKIWDCEFIILGCVKGWANDAANPVVTHWMPRPEPPKEEK